MATGEDALTVGRYARSFARLPSGARFGSLVVQRPVVSPHGGLLRVEVICDCGRWSNVVARDLFSKHTRSCGCGVVRSLVSRSTSHGMSRTPEYRTWARISNRCGNTRSPAYPYYGGRGILMCARWRDSFEAFYADVGPRLTPKHSIDRIDNNGNYEPGNCRWATPKEQANNRRNNRILTVGGISKTMKAWSECSGVPYQVINDRINSLGWSHERALLEGVS